MREENQSHIVFNLFEVLQNVNNTKFVIWNVCYYEGPTIYSRYLYH